MSISDRISTSVKMEKDAYGGFYSCGLTMIDSETMKHFSEISRDETKTVYSSDRGLLMTVSHIVNDTGAVEAMTSITNNSDNAVTLEMLASFVLSGITADKIHRMTSFWSAEGRLKTDKVTDLNLEVSWNHCAFRVEKFGNTGSMPVRRYFPFVALENSLTGMVTAVQLYCSSSWQIELIAQREDSLSISAGLADRDFGQWTKTLKPGETFISPKAVIARGNSLLEACDQLVKSQRPDVSPADDHMGICFNEYCTTWGNPTEENIKKICDRIEGMGIQYLVMDSGWYIPKGAYWWDYTGAWQINKDRFPRGLKPVTDYIRSKGMIPGIWFEFENVSPKCELFNKDEVLVKKDGVPLTVGDRRFLDMENPKVIEKLEKDVIDMLKENGYGYIKVDYNDTMGAGCDGPDGPGENLRRKVEGTRSFFRKMKERIPELVIENCSSGGHRLEPSMMELSSMASFSDAHEIVSLPLIAANLHRVIRPEQSQIWAVMRKEDSRERISFSMCATMLGRMGLSGDIYDLDENQWEMVRDGMDFYREVSLVIKNGRTVMIKAQPESYNNPKGCQLVLREYEGRTLAVFHRFEESLNYADFVSKYAPELTAQRAVLKYGEADTDFSALAVLYEKQ